MSWHILGAGSMGCLWASLLRARDHDVTLLVKDASVIDLYREANGITIERDDLLETIQCDIAVARTLPPAALDDGDTSLIISTKAYDTLGALHTIEPLLPSYRAVVLLQNGMGTLTEIERSFPGLPLYAGVTAHGAWRRSRFHVVHAGLGPTWIGVGVDREPPLARNAVAGLLALPSTMHWDDAIEKRMWIKLAINCVINGLTVLLHCRNGGILAPEQRDRVGLLCAEAHAVLVATLGPDLDVDIHEEVLAVATATASNVSSMLQDVELDRKTEIDYINGYLCRQAEAHGVEVPEQQRLHTELRRMLG